MRKSESMKRNATYLMKPSLKSFSKLAEAHNGNITKMALAIGLNRVTLYRWMQEDGRFRDAIEEHRGRLLDRCLETAGMLANGVADIEETPEGRKLKGWKVYPDGQTLRFLISTLGRKEGFGDSIDVTSKGEKIVQEPFTIEIIDRREQVEDED